MKQNFNFLLITAFVIIIGCSSSSKIENDSTFSLFNPDTVQSYKFDTGKMWTFEDAPVEYFEESYSFKPDQAWLEDVQKSALKFASWCSASFVSEDGLIMTNHHCVDFVISRFEEDGEDFHKTGFYAETLADERKVPSLFVDQLVLIEDVTDEILTAIDEGKTEKEKIKLKSEKKDQLVESYTEETGLTCKIITLYNGGKYSLYGYKRYNDVRAVYINETDMGFFGGDPDNFTYPRYNPDFAFLRVYDDDGQPLKTDYFYKWSEDGAQEDEPIFVVGNPAATFRLKTMSQLEYMRDFTYRNSSYRTSEAVKYYYELIKEDTAKADYYKGMLIYVGNSAKVYKGSYGFLTDPYLMARKNNFEQKFKQAVQSDPELNQKYGHLWDAIAVSINELKKHAGERAAFAISPRSSSKYFIIANNLVELAKQLQLPEEERKDDYKNENLDETITAIFPSNFNRQLEDKKLRLQADYITLNLGKQNWLVQKMFNGLNGDEALEYVLKNSILKDSSSVVELAKMGTDAILNSDDPFIYFIINTQDNLVQLMAEAKEIETTVEVLESELGRALFEIYGTSIPPDASFTLRISDGTLKQFNYNGTVAPTHTTFYGMYDRYNSHNKEYPWNLPERWLNPEEGFELSTPYNFITTNDITGGSSGSAVINKNAEVIGVAFDGNIESIPGNFLYNPSKNRMVSVSSQAMLQILKYIGGAGRISDELELGKIPEEYQENEVVEEPAR